VKVDAPLLGKVRRFLAGHQSSGGIVVAVSGGPDSVALLRALAALQPIPGSLTIAHLNHQLRSAESDADERFVQELPAALPGPVQVRVTRVNVAAQARAAHGNLEAVARQLRYDWLLQVALDVGSRWVATGHTADDQAETVLHRLLRGTGLQGLRGIAPRRPLGPDVTLIRPLLQVPRSEVLAYLEAVGQPFRLDSSNRDLTRTRNRIRHKLLPYLAEHYQPAVARTLARLASQAEEVCHEREALTLRLLAEAERPSAGTLRVLDRQCLAAAPRQRIREVFRLLWMREDWPAGRMTFDAWDRLAGVALGEAVSVDLPGGLRACCRERVVQVGPVA
jgi:tRNA(Ile)-lysidine synthase